MKKKYDINYYTLDKIAEHRLDYIDLHLLKFLNLYNIKADSWPIDCPKIIQKMRSSGIINLEYTFQDLSDKLDAITTYNPEEKIYLIQFNKNRIRYPFQTSSDRRFNFTLAHEIGHIVLEHLLIPVDLKTKADIDHEEKEADEFAGRFLMPEHLIYSCNFYSLAMIAKSFNVSKTALWMRLNNMKRLDLINSKVIRSCNKCGNTDFSMFSEYCGICGNPLNKATLKGIRKIYYPQEIEMDQFKRALTCSLCKKDLTHISGDKCSSCGTYIFNLCSDFTNNGCINANPGNSRYCEICGKPTYYFNKGLIRPWQDVAIEYEQSHLYCALEEE